MVPWSSTRGQSGASQEMDVEVLVLRSLEQRFLDRRQLGLMG